MRFVVVKKKVLTRLENIKPLLKEVADFYNLGAMGYGLAPPGKVLGQAGIPDIRRAELQGIKNAIAVISSIPDDVKVKNEKVAVDLILRVLSEMPSKNVFSNFSKERVTNIIKHSMEKTAKNKNEPPWRVTFLDNDEVLIPGGSKGLSELLNAQRKIYWKTYSFLSEVKKYLLKDITPTTEHFYMRIDHEPIMENFEISKDEVGSFIFSKLSPVIETFFPSLRFEGSRIKASIVPPLFFLVFTSNDMICLLLLLPEHKQTLLFLLPISEYGRQFSYVHFHLLRRYIDFLEGVEKDDLSLPFIFWVEEKYLQSCIPPDAKLLFKQNGDVLLFFSRETHLFFQILKEGKPYYRITMFPQEYILRCFENSISDVSSLKNRNIKGGF